MNRDELIRQAQEHSDSQGPPHVKIQTIEEACIYWYEGFRVYKDVADVAHARLEELAKKIGA